MVSMQSRPWLTVFLINARPPSSPVIKRLGTLVSSSVVRYGRFALTPGAACTIVIAPTGQASAHIPWPMHLYGLISAALPPTMPSTSPSGHTCVQPWQPMQLLTSM